MSGGNGGGSGGGADAPGGMGIGPADYGTGGSGYNPHRSGQDNVVAKKKTGPTAAEITAANKTQAADEAEAKKKAKKEEERKNRSLLTGYTDPNINRRRLLRAADGGTIGEDTSTQLI